MALPYIDLLCYYCGCSIGQRQEDNLLLTLLLEPAGIPPYLPVFFISSEGVDTVRQKTPGVLKLPGVWQIAPDFWEDTF